MEKGKEFYNEVYTQGGNNGEYFKGTFQSIYFPIWEKLNTFINKEERIFEIGCGVGQLAWYLAREGKNYIKGVDFSDVAINKAKFNNLHSNPRSTFEIKDIYIINPIELIGYSTFVCCEVLEHLENDLSLIKKLPTQEKFIFTVPNYMSKSHVRCFNTIEEIKERYEQYLNFISVDEFYINKKKINKIFLIKSFVK